MDADEKISEHAEKEAARCLHEHCPQAARKELGLELTEVADALVSVSRGDPSILINRVVGLGTEGPVEKNTLEAICGIYQKAGVKRFFLHVYPETLPPEGQKWLKDLGLVKARGWRKFTRGDEPAPKARTDLRIERVGPDHSMDFGRIACAAFDLTEKCIPMAAGLVEDERCHLYMSFEGDTPAGTGLLLVDGQTGWLEWGATDPKFRGRGGQGAVMAARIQAALDAGCTRMFTETGEAVEGDPQHSYHNIERAGFRAGALRENWTWPAT